MEEIEVKFEKVEVKAGTKKLEKEWTFEMGDDIIMYYCPPTRWERFCHWVKYLFVKGKIEKL